jgi:hypothetical protein
MSYSFHPGWSPTFASKAKTGPSYLQLNVGAGDPFASDDRPLPPSFSLARFREWPFDQGAVGSCFANAATQAFQIHTKADIATGASWESVELSRRIVWYQGRKLDGLLGSRSDGGSVTNALAALADPPHGVGCCKEATWPYQPDHRWLEQTPPANVFSEAGQNRLKQVADVQIGADWQKAIVNGHPVALGIWWPYGWDTQGATFMDSIGRGEYGHALCVIGWLDRAGVLYWQIENSHGPIYKPLPADLAATVPGYVPARPDATFDFWVRDDLLRKVVGYGQSEAVAAAGMSGFQNRNLVDWFGMMG